METITERNSITAEENAAAADELNGQAQIIMAIVQQLEALFAGKKSLEKK